MARPPSWEDDVAICGALRHATTTARVVYGTWRTRPAAPANAATLARARMAHHVRPSDVDIAGHRRAGGRDHCDQPAELGHSDFRGLSHIVDSDNTIGYNGGGSG